MGKLKSQLIALLFVSLCGCDTLFEKNNNTEHMSDRVAQSPEKDPTAGSNPDSNQQSTTEPQSEEDTSIDESLPAGENSLDYEVALMENDNARNFSDWMQTPDGSDQVAQVGRYIARENELNLNKDTLLSFSTFAQDKALRIRTHGNKLILIGKSMKNLFVETQSEGKPSGDVFVFVTSNELPSINTEGHEGRTGVDAVCPESSNSCVEIRDRISRRTRMDTKFKWAVEFREARYAWSDSFVSNEMKEKIKTLVQHGTPDHFRSELCGTGEVIRIDAGEPFFEGEFTFRQKMRYPHPEQPTEDEAFPHAHLVEGENGHDGQDAGHVRIFQLSENRRILETVMRGGKAGRGGKNLKIPALEKNEELNLESEVLDEWIDIDGMVAKRNVLGTCSNELGGNNRNAFRVFSVGFQSKTTSIKTNVQLDRHSLKIISRAAGNDLDPETPLAARSGVDGKSAIARWETVRNWSAWRKLIPQGVELPREVLNQSASIISPERFSGAVLGLSTLPL